MEKDKQRIVTTPAESRGQKGEHWWSHPFVWLLGIPTLVMLRGLSSRNWLTILVSLLLFAAIIFLLLHSIGGSSRSDNNSYVIPSPETGSPYVPPVQPMKPIDPGKIGFDRDSVTPIITDRINVLLEKRMEEYTAEDFQQEFKRLYPSSEYEVVYYDSLTYRMQLQVPSEKRDYMIDHLNQEMPRFTFYLYDETVFMASYSPNDVGIVTGKDWFLKAIHCYEAWDITMGTENISIAVVDNGFDLSHPELRDHVICPYNVVERNTHLYPPVTNDPNREPGHGTHVAATAIGTADNVVGVCGVAPKCKLIPVQVADRQGIMPLTHILDGVLYAIYQGADVVNVSLGIAVPEQIEKLSPSDQLQIIVGLHKNEERVWDEVFRIANDRNATIVLAAGNEHVLSGFDAMKRSGQTIIVSAVNMDLHQAWFSNYGNYTNVPFCFSTVSAPGMNIYSAYPGNSYKTMDGTSMASPIVAGSVALMKSLNKDLTTTQIIEILQNTGVEMAEPIGNLIQLDAALKAVQSGNYDKKSTGRNELPLDDNKLKTGDVLDDIANIYGLWKSSQSLRNSDDEEIDLYMSFTPQRGQLIIIEKNNQQFKADLDARVLNGEFRITQLGPAIGYDKSHYNPYDYICSTDKQGYLQCHAKQQNGNSQVNFNLIKIK